MLIENRSRNLGLCLVACLFVLPMAPAMAQPRSATSLERLTQVARLWGTVRYLHPYLAYKDIDWDAALVAALPRIREASTTDAYRAAVQQMLAALEDPVTQVETKGTRASAPPARATTTGLHRFVEPGILLVDFSQVSASLSLGDVRRLTAEISGELAQATAVVLDLRTRSVSDEDLAGMWASSLFESLAPALVLSRIQAPAQRFVSHEGYRNLGGGGTSYSSTFVTLTAEAIDPPATPRASALRTVMVFDESSNVPPLALALKAAGRARIVVEGRIAETALVDTKAVEIGEGLVARVRLSELVPMRGWQGWRADAEVPRGARAEALALAVEHARRGWTVAPDAVAEPARLPEARVRRDNAYSDMSEPTLDYRQLAVIRAWNVIHYFYPYLPLLDDWDAVLPRLLERMEHVTTGRAYRLAIAEMMTAVADGHTRVSGHPDVDAPFGAAWMRLNVRSVEGRPVVVAMGDEERARGVEIGDAVVAIGGEPVAQIVERCRQLVTASTPTAVLNRIYQRCLLSGPPDSTTLTVEAPDGRRREVQVTRRTAQAPFTRSDAVVQRLPGDIGYVDLSRLEVADVDTMFETLRNTRGLVFDMRGYPRGTAWTIAPRINTRRTKVGASIGVPYVNASQDDNAPVTLSFGQPLPPLPAGTAVYSAPTVMLIDSRAISQAEHTGLFFKAASGTTFVGTATAGANGNVTDFTVPGGLTITFTGLEIRHADGRQLQRVGLVPDIPVEPTRAGLKAGRDEVLEKAVEYLKSLPPR